MSTGPRSFPIVGTWVPVNPEMRAGCGLDERWAWSTFAPPTRRRIRVLFRDADGEVMRVDIPRDLFCDTGVDLWALIRLKMAQRVVAPS